MKNEMMEFQSGEMAGQTNTTTEMAVSRQAQEVQAAMIVAKKFPRNEMDAINRVLRSCDRPSLAERAIYEYPKGGTSVTGPSIRLAEAMAQNWGNLDFGIVELDQKSGESTIMSYCWDLETNTRQTKIFTVPHIRQTKKGAQMLTDPRDIYEMVANQGARRLRACILGVIPGDVVDAALDACQKTLAGKSKLPLVDRVRKMVRAFQDDFGVPKEALEQYAGFKAEAFTEQTVVRLRGVYQSLKDGMASREQYFDLSGVPAQEAPKNVDMPKDGKQDTEVSMDDL
ncbi:MAG: hypothetical protein VB071_03235 [Lawsonibacter sp.]|nr:hypothetical protein [Lawsonibacter sp.]